MHSSIRTHLILASITCLAGLATSFPLHAAEQPAPPAEAALSMLTEGNSRFVDDKTQHGHSSASWRKSLTEGQHPFAIIVSCSDSRVPTELVFDQGFGDLFVIRNAGNIIATDVLGSIGYAIAHLNCNLVVIMGHESCDAVTAALMTPEDRAKEAPEVQDVLEDIVVGFEKVKLPVDDKARVAAGVEANVHWSVQQLNDLKGDRKFVGTEKLEIVGAVYELETGKVRLLKK